MALETQPLDPPGGAVSDQPPEPPPEQPYQIPGTEPAFEPGTLPGGRPMTAADAEPFIQKVIA